MNMNVVNGALRMKIGIYIFVFLACDFFFLLLLLEICIIAPKNSHPSPLLFHNTIGKRKKKKKGLGDILRPSHTLLYLAIYGHSPRKKKGEFVRGFPPPLQIVRFLPRPPCPSIPLHPHSHPSPHLPLFLPSPPPPPKKNPHSPSPSPSLRVVDLATNDILGRVWKNGKPPPP